MRRLRLLADDELDALPGLRPLIANVIDAGTLTVLYGPAEVGKSFLAISIANAVATGMPWLGREVQPGAVVYVAAEGTIGLAARVRACRHVQGGNTGARANSVQPINPDGALARALRKSTRLWFIAEPVNLLTDSDLLLAELRPLHPVLLVVDTLSRCMSGGDENSSRDMGLVVAALDRLRAELGTAVVLVHHSGKNAESERGSSALRAAADTMLAVSKNGNTLTIRRTKQRHRPSVAPVLARLVPIADAGSCAVEPRGAGDETLSGPRLDALRALVALCGGAAAYTDWLRRSQVAETTFRRAVPWLVAAGYVAAPESGGKRGGEYRATSLGRAVLAATAPGGGPSTARQGFSGLSAHRHSPPRHRHGVEPPSPPPATPPIKGGGGGAVADGADGGDAKGVV